LRTIIGYVDLKALRIEMCCIPVSTVSSFSAIVRLMTKLTNRNGHGTLQYRMKTCVEGSSEIAVDLLDEGNDTFSRDEQQLTVEESLNWH
jgi:hypothetical protein